MRLFILIFGLVGIGMGVGEIFILKNLYDFRSQALVTEGEVVDFVTSRGRKGGTMYAPRVRYAIPAPEGGVGAEYEIVGRVSSSGRSFDIGERVGVPRSTEPLPFVPAICMNLRSSCGSPSSCNRPRIVSKPSTLPYFDISSKYTLASL